MREANEILKYHRPPDYPVEARRAHVTGNGKFQINFRPDGKVKDIAVLRSTGYIILDHACLWALVHWQLRHPGETDSVRVPITFYFGR